MKFMHILRKLGNEEELFFFFFLNHDLSETLTPAKKWIEHN